MPKTNKYAFVKFYETPQELEDFQRQVAYLVACHYQAVISPLHDSDYWDEWSVLHYIKTNNERFKVKIDPKSDVWFRPTGKVISRGKQCGEIETVAVPVPKVGQSKKPHRHFGVKLDYSMPLQTFLNEITEVFDLSYIEPMRSERGFCRYLIHKDNPEKAAYERDEVIALGGYDIKPLYESSVQDIQIVCDTIMSAHLDNPHVNMQGLADYFYSIGDWDAFNELKNHANFWKSQLWVHDSKTPNVKVLR